MPAEIWLEPGGDFVQLPNGDLKLAFDDPTTNTTDATRQRIYRMLTTNPRIIGSNNVPISAPGDLIHPDYGAGLPALVGQPIDVVIEQATPRINRWISADPTIAQNPPPIITITQLSINVVQVRIQCQTVGGQKVDMTFPIGTPPTPASAGLPSIS